MIRLPTPNYCPERVGRIFGWAAVKHTAPKGKVDEIWYMECAGSLSRHSLCEGGSEAATALAQGRKATPPIKPWNVETTSVNFVLDFTLPP